MRKMSSIPPRVASWIKEVDGAARTVLVPNAPARALNDLIEFLKSPESQQLNEIIVSGGMKFLKSESVLVEAIRSRDNSKALKNLALAADHDDSGGNETGVPLGRLAELWPNVPNLKYLYLKGSSRPITDPEDIYFDKETSIQTDLGKLDLPELKKFKRRADDFSRLELKSIVAGALPSLEELILIPGAESDVNVTDFAEVFQLKRLATLNSFGIQRTRDTASYLREVAASALLPKLRRLSFEAGDLTDRDAEYVISNSSKFEKLGFFDLNLNRLSDAAAATVKDVLPNVRASKQREGDEPIYVNKIYQEAYRLDD